MILVRRLKEYAKLIVRVGANVQKGQHVIINASVEDPKFVELVVKEAYKAGARKVEIRWNYQPLMKTKVKYESVATLAEVTDWEKARLEHYLQVKPVMINLMSVDPNGSQGIDQMKMAKARQKSYPIIKKYFDAMDNQYQWTIAGVPCEKWAKAVFPEFPRVKAMKALWEAVLEASRANGDALKNWEEHNATLKEKSDKLNALKLARLEYRASNGTNFSVGLLPNAKFIAGGEYTLSGNFYNPNIPTEECFTTPRRGDAEGILYSTMPLSYQGEIIDNFWLRFANGKVVEVHAEKNQALLEQMVKMDEGAAYLGEVALVPFDSPIRKAGIIFQNTLYDENAACHFALGSGFRNCIEDYQNYQPEEFKELGVNDSMIHVDFMVGCEDLEIDGVTATGKKVAIFRKGNWAI
ncbi:MAG: aminopeptidase [Bacilli bacterium]